MVFLTCIWNTCCLINWNETTLSGALISIFYFFFFDCRFIEFLSDWFQVCNQKSANSCKFKVTATCRWSAVSFSEWVYHRLVGRVISLLNCFSNRKYVLLCKIKSTKVFKYNEHPKIVCKKFYILCVFFYEHLVTNVSWSYNSLKFNSFFTISTTW